MGMFVDEYFSTWMGMREMDLSFRMFSISDWGRLTWTIGAREWSLYWRRLTELTIMLFARSSALISLRGKSVGIYLRITLAGRDFFGL